MADQEEKMLTVEEAFGVIELLKCYFMTAHSGFPRQDAVAGRLLSEALFTLEVQFTLETPAAELPGNVHALPR